MIIDAFDDGKKQEISNMNNINNVNNNLNPNIEPIPPPAPKQTKPRKPRQPRANKNSAKNLNFTNHSDSFDQKQMTKQSALNFEHPPHPITSAASNYLFQNLHTADLGRYLSKKPAADNASSFGNANNSNASNDHYVDDHQSEPNKTINGGTALKLTIKKLNHEHDSYTLVKSPPKSPEKSNLDYIKRKHTDNNSPDHKNKKQK